MLSFSPWSVCWDSDTDIPEMAQPRDHAALAGLLAEVGPSPAPAEPARSRAALPSSHGAEQCPSTANLHQGFWGLCSRASPHAASTRGTKCICISKGSARCIRSSSCRAPRMSLHQVPTMQVTSAKQIKALLKLKPSSNSVLTSSDCSSFPTWAASVFLMGFGWPGKLAASWR